MGIVKTEKTKPSASECRGGSETKRLRFCASCPIAPPSRTTDSDSPIKSGPTCSILHSLESLMTHRTGSMPNLVPCSNLHTSHWGGAKSCPPPPSPCNCGPCPGCCPNCCSALPPPCNTPPKCIQYMTGYYYYPYGFWFCGPYHVSGTCTPCGPCCPSSSSCCKPPCPPCPPCPPPNPCPKCCLCPKCCTCMNPIDSAIGSDSEPRCQSVRANHPPPSAPHQQAINYPLPTQPTKPEKTPQPRSKGGIAKFFPFNGIPALVPPCHQMPHSSVNVCPYSTQPQTFQHPNALHEQEHPIYYIPSVKSGFSPRLRYPIYNMYDKRSEHKSPIHHRRSKRSRELGPILESPRYLLTKEQRDRPATFPGAFQYTNIPNYRKPYPPRSSDVSDYKEYET